MQKVFIALLVVVCVFMFAVPLMAADSPMGMALASFQALDNAQLDQIRGQGWEGRPEGFKNFTPPNPYPHGLDTAYLKNGTYSEENPNTLNSRVFIYVKTLK